MGTWDALKLTDEENVRLCWLRAVEWGAWPVFASQIFAPLFLIIWPWHFVIGGVFLANVLWAVFVRYRFISFGLANALAIAMFLKWPITIGSAAYLFYEGRTPIAVLALLWPLIVIFLGFVTPTQIGILQQEFMRQLGYQTSDAAESKELAEFEHEDRVAANVATQSINAKHLADVVSRFKLTPQDLELLYARLRVQGLTSSEALSAMTRPEVVEFYFDKIGREDHCTLETSMQLTLLARNELA